MEKKKRYSLSLLLLGGLAALFFVLGLSLGSVSIPAGHVWKILLAHQGNRTEMSILLEIRLPRAIAASALGGALSVSGYLLQTYFDNPIAGPYVLGISSGAKLVVAVMMVLFLGHGLIPTSLSMIIAAFIGAMLSMGFVLLVAGRVKRMAYLIICGIMIGYICSAITEFLVTFADDSNIVNLHNWSMGSFSGITWQQVPVIVIVTAACMALTLFLIKPMNAIQLGETYASNMGVNLKRFRLALILLSSFLSAVVTAFAGPVSFVGIAVPHLCRSLLKSNRAGLMIPASFLGGAVFCMGCDLLARTIFAPTEMSISAVTAVLGAPIVIYLMVRRQKGRRD